MPTPPKPANLHNPVGRPRSPDAKQNITLRLSPAAIEAVRRLGTAAVDALLRGA